jgi:hypothetical protein
MWDCRLKCDITIVGSTTTTPQYNYPSPSLPPIPPLLNPIPIPSAPTTKGSDHLSTGLYVNSQPYFEFWARKILINFLQFGPKWFQFGPK